jgi:hypothetical protein
MLVASFLALSYKTDHKLTLINHFYYYSSHFSKWTKIPTEISESNKTSTTNPPYLKPNEIVVSQENTRN